jgi:ABC-type multidrug transport system ATPase subunit
VLEIVDLRKAFGGVAVLGGASLSLDRGESVGLIGANGCGKTTTLRCVVGLSHPDAGRVSIDGLDMAARGREARARLSYLPQRTALPPTVTARESLAVVAELRGSPRNAVDREIERFALGEFADRPIAELSGGQRQRVALAIALLPDVPLYVLDEPSLNLDAASRQRLSSRLFELRDSGRSILFTTHVTDELAALATRVAVLENGRIVDRAPVQSSDFNLEERDSHATPSNLRTAAGAHWHDLLRRGNEWPRATAAGSR